MRVVRLLATVLALVAVAAGCTSGGSGRAGGTVVGRKPKVVVTTSILGDVTRQVAGDLADVELLIPNGTDPHDAELSAAEVARLRSADLVVANGLGLEERLRGALDGARSDGVRVLEVGPQLNPLPLARTEHGATTGSAPPTADGPPDPHVWLDPDRMSQAGRLIAGALGDLGGDRARLGQQADAFAEAMARADEDVQATLAPLPDDRRLLVTNHESMGYWAERYGFRIVGAVIPGGSTLAEPSAADLAALARQLDETGVQAIFAETTQPAKLADALAAQTGRSVRVVPLYTEALGDPGSGADTLAGLLVTDAHRIADALGAPAAPGPGTSAGATTAPASP